MNSTTAITVRLATLEDTFAITGIHKSNKTHWERFNGESEPARYEDLSLFERWQQGGPWVSAETCAVHLNRLLAGSGTPLVAEQDGTVLGEAEVYESFEPAPFGHHLGLAVLTTHVEADRDEVSAGLMNYIIEMARLMKCDRITAAPNEGEGSFYVKHGFRHSRVGRGIRLSAQAGRAFYQATALTDNNPEQIKNWFMPLGHYQSSRQEWEKLFPQQWAAGVPELLNPTTHHLKLSVTGQNAILFMRDSGEPGEVQLACWSPRPLSNPVLTAIRDRVFREGYQTITSYVMESDLPTLGNDVRTTDFVHHGYGPDACSLHYTGYLDETPVTSGTVLDAGGWATIYDISTPPAFRQQGFGGAITHALMQKIRDRGYADTWIWASDMAKTLYRKLGYVDVDFGVRTHSWHRRS